MFNTNISNIKTSTGESGNAVIIVLVALVVVAVGVLAYLSGYIGGDKGNVSVATAEQETAVGGEDQAMQIKPGNPVVAKVGDEDITRVEVFNYIQQLPPNARQLPVAELFPVALEQVINNQVVENKTKSVNLDNDPEVKKQLAIAKDNIVRTIYLQNEIQKRITDERLQEAYKAYSEGFPQVEERSARHILVKDEGLAKDLIKKLKDGADFATLAKENSTDGTAQNGGELGYFAKADVVPEFAGAAFSTEPGTFTGAPVKTDFGYHIIKVEDKRIRQPATFEAAKPFLETQLRRLMLEKVVAEWRDAADIKRYDINGDEVEPASGEESGPVGKASQ